MKKFLVLVMALCVLFTLGLAHAETADEAVKLGVAIQGHAEDCKDTAAELKACEHVECYKAPTCTDKGAQAKHCTACGQIIEIEELAATDHSMKDVAAETPDCTKDCTQAYKKCEKCDYMTDMDGKEIKAPEVVKAKNTEHVRIADPDETFVDVCGEAVSLPAVCRDCGKELDGTVDFVVDHGKNYEKVTKKAQAPTCQAAGWTEEITCTFEGCNKVKVESKELAVVDHNWVYRAGTAGAPCTETEWPDHYACSFNCGTYHRNQKDEKGNLILLTGADIFIKGTDHQWSEPVDIEETCTTPGYWGYQKCTACGAETWYKKIEAQHDVARNTGKAATCTEDGVNAYNYCTRCDWTDGSDTVIPAHGHSYEEGTVPGEPTEKREVTEEDKKGVTGHEVYADWEEDKDLAATCEEDGYQAARYCEFCLKLNKKAEPYTPAKVLPKTGHDWKVVEGSVGVAPTCDNKGTSVEQYCANKGCNATKGGVEGDIAALGHIWATYEAQLNTCTEAGNYAFMYCTRETCDVKDQWDAKLVELEEDAFMSNPAAPNADVPATSFVTKKDGKIVVPSEWVMPAINHGKIAYGDDEAALLKDGIWAEIAPVKETCTTNGRDEGGIYCTLCNAVIVKPVVIPATGHNYSEVIEAVEPTCTEAGYTYFQYCTNEGCNVAVPAVSLLGDAAEITIVKKDDGTVDMSKLPAELIFPALGHDEVEVETKAATCLEDGYTGGVICDRCKVTIKEATVLKATGHSKELKVVKAGKEPTCTVKGLEPVKQCQNPGCEYTEGGKEIPALGHDYANAVVIPGVAATCGKDGKTEAYKCGRCDEYIIDHDVIKATGKHTWTFVNEKGEKANKTAKELKEGEFLCEVALYDDYNKCTVCGLVEGKTWGGEGHDIVTYDEEKPTCTQMGLTGDAYCLNECGYHVVNQVVPALGHAPVKYYGGNVKVSCTKAGWTEGEKCERCGEIFTKSVWAQPLNHKYADGKDAWEHVEAVEPTCTTAGSKIGLKCALCGATSGCEKVEALGHDTNGVEWTVLTDEDGTSLRVKRCKTCNLIVEMKPIQSAGKLGDVDGNGRVNLTDALLVIEFYVGNEPSSFNEEVADFNLDGKINTDDALAIVNFWAGA